MPDKLFEIVLAALQKIPHVKIKDAHRNRVPLRMYGGLIFDDSGQIIVGFDTAPKKKWGINSYQSGKPLANLEDVRHELALDNRVWWPICYNESFLVYERPMFDGIRYERGKIELVAVGTLPFFGHPNENGYSRGYMTIKDFFPYDLCDRGIDSRLIDHHTENRSHLS